mmetsp:Transcript_33114/g.50771  ORF Transcript_33114/g.50771 Transcript_33114/m.50771 type:complete len:92 (-) Transcript_33114:188-463(-)
MAAEKFWNFLILVAFLVLINASFSMLQYRRHVQLYSPDLISDGFFTMPLDIKVEALIGLALGVFSAINKFASNLKTINMRDVSATQTKTFE